MPIVGLAAISFSVKKMDASRVSLSLLSQSVVTGFIAWLFINEKISTQMIIGGLIILLGIGITFKKSGENAGIATIAKKTKL